MALSRRLLPILVFLFLLTFSQGCMREYLGLPVRATTPPAHLTPQGTRTPVLTTPIPAVQKAGVGESITRGNLRVTVLGYTLQDTINGFPPYTEGYRWVILDMTAENLDPVKEISLWPGPWDPPWWVTDSAGYRYQALGYNGLDHQFDGTHILPGETRRGYALTAVPRGATGLDFIYDFGGANVAVFSLD